MIESKPVYMGTMASNWAKNKKTKTITFSITDECNLRCTYCYFTHKTHKNVMSFETAQKAIDDILTESIYDISDGVVWEFIGGEPTLEMGLIDKISDYILYKMYRLNHKWLYCYRFMVGTNGLLYDTPLVQKYISKHRGNLYVAMTIDGTKEKHDLSRIKKDGSGSFEDVKKMFPLWAKQFGGRTTKATFSHDDLPYLKDSIISLWNMGIKSIAANIVFEDVWEKEDVNIYKEQLYKLADYIIENDLWDTYSVRFFSPSTGTPYTSENMLLNHCGTGNMLAINTEGDYFPCVRFMPSATNKNHFAPLGSINSKVNTDRLRPFYALNTYNQSSKKCLECDVAGGCHWCSGLNYDCSSIGTVFERQMYICDMHKANVEVNKYLWKQYELIKHSISPYRYIKLTSTSPYNKYIYILCDGKFPTFCEYKNNDSLQNEQMSTSMLIKAIEFCENNNFVPIICGAAEIPEDYYAHQIVSYSDYLNGKQKISKNCFTHLLLNANDNIDDIDIDIFENLVNIIVSYKASQVNAVQQIIYKLNSKKRSANISLFISEIDVDCKQYIKDYNMLLKSLIEHIDECWKKENYVNINVLTNELFANNNRWCGAGKNSYALGPNGKFYLCAGFYHSSPDDCVGNLKTGINNKYIQYCDMDQAPLCEKCEVRHCNRCVLRNKIGTNEFHIPTELQCVITRMEYDYSCKLSELINKNEKVLPFEYRKKLLKIDTFDSLSITRGSEYPQQGYSEIVSKLNSN